MVAAISVASLQLVTACGAPSPPRPGPSCDEARDRAVRTWTALAAEVEPGEPRELPPAYAQLETLRERLTQHQGEDVTLADAEAEALANALMDAIDACEGMLPAPLRDRAESAAEALLTERRDGAGAVRDAIAVIDAMERAAHPDLTRVDPRAGHAQAELARRIAAAYGADTAHADELAERWARTGAASEAAALEASGDVRERCAFERTLATPSF